MWGIPGNHSNFVPCHDSLNSVNSGKVIEEKLNWAVTQNVEFRLQGKGFGLVRHRSF